jgi:serine/threonine protein phosphatase PrpC
VWSLLEVMHILDGSGDYVGPARVWLGHEASPGLAMSRSMGDTVGAQAGVISTPEIIEFELRQNDKFIILGTDGLWEFLDNQLCVDLVGEYWKLGNIEGSCERLVKEAVDVWNKV